LLSEDQATCIPTIPAASSSPSIIFFARRYFSSPLSACSSPFPSSSTES
jgi:hypothetical protein